MRSEFPFPSIVCEEKILYDHFWQIEYFTKKKPDDRPGIVIFNIMNDLFENFLHLIPEFLAKSAGIQLQHFSVCALN